jgi:integrase
VLVRALLETKEPTKHVLPKEQARLLLDSLPFRDRLMAMIAAFCALRPGEIFGLRWSSLRGDHFHIEGTAWRGMLRPGKAKTKGSKASVTIPDVLLPALEMWRAQNANVPLDALIFPSEKGTPMRPENWLRRRIKPIARTAGICVPVNFSGFAAHVCNERPRLRESERRSGTPAPQRYNHHVQRVHTDGPGERAKARQRGDE